MNGGTLEKIKVSANKIVTKEYEGAICKYINRFDKIYTCTYLQIIVRNANYLIYIENCVFGQ